MKGAQIFIYRTLRTVQHYREIRNLGNHHLECTLRNCSSVTLMLKKVRQAMFQKGKTNLYWTEYIPNNLLPQVYIWKLNVPLWVIRGQSEDGSTLLFSTSLGDNCISLYIILRNYRKSGIVRGMDRARSQIYLRKGHWGVLGQYREVIFDGNKRY